MQVLTAQVRKLSVRIFIVAIVSWRREGCFGCARVYSKWTKRRGEEARRGDEADMELFWWPGCGEARLD